MRNFSKLKIEIENEIIDKEYIAVAWKKVKYCAKKDGTRYAVMSRNIKGARYDTGHNSYYPNRPILEIHTYGHDGFFVEDTINCYSFANEEPRAKTKPQNLGPETTDWRQLYIFDFDDIVEAVEQRIEQLKEQVNRLRKQLEVLEKSVKSYVKSIKAANQELKTALGSCTWIYNEIKQMAQFV